MFTKHKKVSILLFILLSFCSAYAHNINPKAQIHPTAVLIGNVTVGAYTKIGPKVVIMGNVTIGHHVNILGQAVINVDKLTIGNYVRIDYGSRIVSGREAIPGITANTVADVSYIGDNCWIGGNATVRGSRLENGSVVGMRAVADFNTHLESGAVLAPGAVSLINMVIPANCLAEGIPAELTKRNISDNDRHKIFGVIPVKWIQYDNDQIAKEINKNPPKVNASYPGIDHRKLWKGAKVDPTAQVHPSAILSNCTIGAYTKIGPYVVIDRAIIGNHCEIRANSNIRSDVTIGNYCFFGERFHLGSSRTGGSDNPLWIKDYVYVSPGSVVHATKVESGVYYGANVLTDYGDWIFDNALLMSGCSLQSDHYVREEAIFRGNLALMDEDRGTPDSLWMALVGFQPKRWLKEVYGPALEKIETYETPLANWDYTNKGVVSPKAKIVPGAYVVGNVTLEDGVVVNQGAYLEGNIIVEKDTKIYPGTMVVSNGLSIGHNTRMYDQAMVVDGRTAVSDGCLKVDKTRVGIFAWINHMMLLQGGIMNDFSNMNIGTGAAFGTRLNQEALLLNGSVTYADQQLPERSITYGVPAEVRVLNTTMRERMQFFYGKSFPNWERMAEPDYLKMIKLPD